MGKYHDGYMRVIPKLGAHPGKDGTLRCSSLPAGPPCAQTRAAVSGNSASSFPGEELRAGMKRQRHHVPEERMSNKHRRRRGLSNPMTRGVDQPQRPGGQLLQAFERQGRTDGQTLSEFHRFMSVVEVGQLTQSR